MTSSRSLATSAVVAISVVGALACLLACASTVCADAIVGPEPSPSLTLSPTPDTSRTAAATTIPASGSGGTRDLAVLAGTGVTVAAVAAGACLGLRRLAGVTTTQDGLDGGGDGARRRSDGEAGT